MIKLYDSRTKQNVLIDENEISIYNCGPTVYNHIHIGNARPLVTFDVLNRLFLFLNKKVTYVLNITDIDDKIINKAIQENIPELELSNYYTDQYILIQKKLNILPMLNPKVSDNIDGIISYIEDIVDKKYGYIASDGDVYFDVTKLTNYGEASGQKVDELISGNRIEKDNNKKSKNDFVLWKKTKTGIQWDTKWFKGRPGWHSECSYLINKYIGKQVTIHGGGMDLKFPHHENENAQNQALHNCSLAKVWLHVGMINIDNEKMSKSLNNFILTKDVLGKYSYQALRWFFYQTSFSNPLNYSDKIMQQMENEINKIKLTINNAKNFLIIANQDLNFDSNLIDDKFIEHLSNNLNLVNAVTEVYNICKKINQYTREKNIDETKKELNILMNALNILGIELPNFHNEEVSMLLKQWDELKNKKDFEKADQIRLQLSSKGVL